MPTSYVRTSFIFFAFFFFYINRMNCIDNIISHGRQYLCACVEHSHTQAYPAAQNGCAYISHVVCNVNMLESIWYICWPLKRINCVYWVKISFGQLSVSNKQFRIVSKCARNRRIPMNYYVVRAFVFVLKKKMRVNRSDGDHPHDCSMPHS